MNPTTNWRDSKLPTTEHYDALRALLREHKFDDARDLIDAIEDEAQREAEANEAEAERDMADDIAAWSRDRGV